jgi:diguanylate cyclase (GGDEF)-like protein
VSDLILTQYYEAVIAMQKGRFDVSIPDASNGGLGRLGHALSELAHTLEQKFEEGEKLSKITEKANSGLILDEVLNYFYESFRPIIPYNRIGLALLEDEGRFVRARWARSDAVALCLKEGYSAPLKGSSLEEIIRTDKPRILNDLEGYLRDNPKSESTQLIVKEGMRSSLTCPLIALGKPIGFIFFSSTEVDTYKDVHQDLFMRIAGQLSVILEKSRLYQQVIELNRKLLVAQSALEHRATHDTLTNVWNRGAIMEVLDKELSRSRRELKPLSVIMTDVDHFKHLNDTHGHLAGDVVLSEVAQRLSSSLRTSEWVGRYGGEEFLIVVYPCDEHAAMSLMERLRGHVCGRAIRTGANKIQTSISLGAAVGHDTKRIGSETFVRVADEARYHAKKTGRNRSEVKTIEMEMV